MSRALVLMVLLSATVACGGGSSTAAPTPTFIQGTSTASATGFQAHSTACVEFQNAKAGQVSAYVTPDTIVVALVTGSCAAPGDVIAEKAGNVTGNAPAGANHIRMTNPTDETLTYTISLTHWY